MPSVAQAINSTLYHEGVIPSVNTSVPLKGTEIAPMMPRMSDIGHHDVLEPNHRPNHMNLFSGCFRGEFGDNTGTGFASLLGTRLKPRDHYELAEMAHPLFDGQNHGVVPFTEHPDLMRMTWPLKALVDRSNVSGINYLDNKQIKCEVVLPNGIKRTEIWELRPEGDGGYVYMGTDNHGTEPKSAARVDEVMDAYNMKYVGFADGPPIPTSIDRPRVDPAYDVRMMAPSKLSNRPIVRVPEVTSINNRMERIMSSVASVDHAEEFKRHEVRSHYEEMGRRLEEKRKKGKIPAYDPYVAHVFPGGTAVHRSKCYHETVTPSYGHQHAMTEASRTTGLAEPVYEDYPPTYPDPPVERCRL
jgi:hypothetical protein